MCRHVCTSDYQYSNPSAYSHPTNLPPTKSLSSPWYPHICSCIPSILGCAKELQACPSVIFLLGGVVVEPPPIKWWVRFRGEIPSSRFLERTMVVVRSHPPLELSPWRARMQLFVAPSCRCGWWNSGRLPRIADVCALRRQLRNHGG